jgi:hypothetical protein
LAGTLGGVPGETGTPFSATEWERFKTDGHTAEDIFTSVCYSGVIFLQKYEKKGEKWMGENKDFGGMDIIL